MTVVLEAPVVEGVEADTYYPARRGNVRSILTKREFEVAECLACGMAYKEIATKLGISFHTVRTHVKTILQKTRLSSSRRFAALFMQTI